jgi:peptide/nickel transport system substrate-binding protein
LARPTSPRYLDPGRDHSNVGSQFYYNAFDTLIDKNVTTPRTPNGSSGAGHRLGSSSIRLTMELTLREGVKFHNGEDMTASTTSSSP